MYLELRNYCDGTQKPFNFKDLESNFKFLQPAGFFGDLFFLLQLQELYLAASFRKIFTHSSSFDSSYYTLDLPKCQTGKLHQYGCFEPQTTAFALHFHHHCDRRISVRRFLSSSGNRLGDFFALSIVDFDAAQQFLCQKFDAHWSECLCCRIVLGHRTGNGHFLVYFINPHRNYENRSEKTYAFGSPRRRINCYFCIFTLSGNGQIYYFLSL